MISSKRMGLGILIIICLLGVFLLVKKDYSHNDRKDLACSRAWTKIFEGRATEPDKQFYSGEEGWSLTPTKPLSYEQLDQMINNGCQFRVLKGLGLGGGHLTESFTCDYVSWKDGGIFHCLGDQFSSNGLASGEFFAGLELQFGYDESQGLGDYPFNGSLYYVPYGEEGFTNVDLTIYAKQ